MSRLVLVRWIFRGTDASADGSRALILSRAVPTRAAVCTAKSYISRQGCDVWLTAIAEDTVILASDNRLAALIPSEHRDRQLSDSDALLADDSSGYVDDLHDVTDLAIELLAADDYRDHQRFLVRRMCADTATVHALREYCQLHSRTYASWSSQHADVFWSRLYAPGPRPELSCPGHWFWNIIVGTQPYPRDDPDLILASIGAA